MGTDDSFGVGGRFFHLFQNFHLFQKFGGAYFGTPIYPRTRTTHILKKYETLKNLTSPIIRLPYIQELELSEIRQSSSEQTTYPRMNSLRELVSENEKLRDENQKLREERALTQMNSLLPNWVNELVAENEKLQTELKDLKEEKARRGYRHEHNGEVSWCKDEEMEELEHFQNIAKHLHENEQDIEEIQEERAESERELKEQHETELTDLKEELEKLKNVCRLEDGRPFTIEGDRFNSGDIFEYAADCHGFQEFVEATSFFEEMNEERDTLQAIVDEGLEHFDEGDILDRAEECDTWFNVIGESQPYQELNGELEILREQLSNLELDHFEEGDILDFASECCGFQDCVEESEFYKDLQEERDDLLEEKKERVFRHEEEINSLKGNFNISTHAGNQMTELMMKAIVELKTELRESQVESEERITGLNRELVANCYEDVVLTRARVFMETNGWKYLTHNGYVKV